MSEPQLGQMLKGTIKGLEENIPQMISFIDSEVDLQPWERYASASYVSDTEAEVNLMALMRDIMGHASLPGVFGRGLLDKFPDILHDVYDMDAGLMIFMMGLPPYTPWPSGESSPHKSCFLKYDHQTYLDNRNTSALQYSSFHRRLTSPQ